MSATMLSIILSTTSSTRAQAQYCMPCHQDSHVYTLVLFVKLYDPYASEKYQIRSDLIGNWLRQTQSEREEIEMNSTDRGWPPAKPNGLFGKTSNERKGVIYIMNKLEWCSKRLVRSYWGVSFHHQIWVYEINQARGRKLYEGSIVTW